MTDHKPCEACGRVFARADLPRTHRYAARWAKRRFCSRPCADAGRTRPADDRFVGMWEVDPVSGCWNWTGRLGANGYGYLHEQGKTVLAHRYSYKKAHGSIPKGLFICHKCDNPRCVRPDHLFLGDQLANMRDCALKGRSSRGSQRPTAKLTEAIVAAARLEGLSAKALAERFRIRKQTARKALVGVTWKHVPMPSTGICCEEAA